MLTVDPILMNATYYDGKEMIVIDVTFALNKISEDKLFKKMSDTTWYTSISNTSFNHVVNKKGKKKSQIELVHVIVVG